MSPKTDDDIVRIQQLQDAMNSSFQTLVKSMRTAKDNEGVVATSKDEVARLAKETLHAMRGPVRSAIDLSYQPIAYMAVRTAIDLNLFEIINQPTSLLEIVERTSADPLVLQRVLRAVSSIGYLRQIDPATWQPTTLAQAVRLPSVRDWLKNVFDFSLRGCAVFPKWLAERYHNAQGDIDDCAAVEAFGSNLWTYYEQHPIQSATFDSSMGIQELAPADTRPPYPFESDHEFAGRASNIVAFVDIGGGRGQAIEQIKSDYPNISGRFILQDLPKTIRTIDSTYARKIGFEPMVHNFFESQPIKGAKFYHLRRILHDWANEPSEKILHNIFLAMKDTPSFSRLLIHDFVLPDVGTGDTEALTDMLMWLTCGGMERSESQFRQLLAKCGFMIMNIWRAKVGNVAVIEAAVKSTVETEDAMVSIGYQNALKH